MPPNRHHRSLRRGGISHDFTGNRSGTGWRYGRTVTPIHQEPDQHRRPAPNPGHGHLTFGVVCYSPETNATQPGLPDFIEQADTAMLKAKKAGRNRLGIAA